MPNRIFCGYPTRWPFLQNTRELDSLAWLFNFQSCAIHMWPFVSYSFHKLVVNCTDSSLKFDSSLISHTHRLQINPHKYREMIEEMTIKFGTELKPTKASWKSQLYKVTIVSICVLIFQILLLNYFNTQVFYWGFQN